MMMPRVDDDEPSRLSKEERAALVAAPWHVERRDQENGVIHYHIVCYDPAWIICLLDDETNQHAKLCADRIVEAHNADIARRAQLGAKR